MGGVCDEAANKKSAVPEIAGIIETTGVVEIMGNG